MAKSRMPDYDRMPDSKIDRLYDETVARTIESRRGTPEQDEPIAPARTRSAKIDYLRTDSVMGTMANILQKSIDAGRDTVIMVSGGEAA